MLCTESKQFVGGLGGGRGFIPKWGSEKQWEGLLEIPFIYRAISREPKIIWNPFNIPFGNLSKPPRITGLRVALRHPRSERPLKPTTQPVNGIRLENGESWCIMYGPMDISLTSLTANHTLGRLGFQQIHPKTSAHFHWKVWNLHRFQPSKAQRLLISRDLDSQFTDSACQNSNMACQDASEASPKKQPPMVHSERLGTTFLDIRTACHISQKAATLGATTTGPSRGSISRTWVQRMKWTSWWGWKGWKNAMDVNDLRITDGGSSDQHPKKNQDRFSNFTKSSRFAGSWGVYMTHPQGASSDPRRHEGRCKDTALPVPRGCLGCSKWGGYPLNSRQFQIILIGKMNKARNSRGIPPFQPSCLQDMISFPWVQPLGNFQSRAALCSRAAVAYFVTLSSHTSLPTCNWVVLSTTDWGFGSASTTAPVAVQEIGKLEALSGSFLKKSGNLYKLSLLMEEHNIS